MAEKDSKMGSHGMATITFTIGGKQCKWPMYIANIHDDILLGAYFLDYHDATINIKRGLFIGGTWLQCATERKRNGINQIMIRKRTVITAEHEMVIMGSPDREIKSTKMACMLEPDHPLGFEMRSENDTGLMIGRILVNHQQVCIPVKCLNTSRESVVIEKGQILGNFEEVDTLVTLTCMDNNQPMGRCDIV